jgi:hypothetical protein
MPPKNYIKRNFFNEDAIIMYIIAAAAATNTAWAQSGDEL